MRRLRDAAAEVCDDLDAVTAERDRLTERIAELVSEGKQLRAEIARLRELLNEAGIAEAAT
jgi:regulator of replication initiation timing